MSRRPRGASNLGFWEKELAGIEKRLKSEGTERETEEAVERTELVGQEGGPEEVEVEGRPRRIRTPSWKPTIPAGYARIIKGYLPPRGQGSRARRQKTEVGQGPVVAVRREEIVRVGGEITGTTAEPRVIRAETGGGRDRGIIIGALLFVVGASAGWVIRGMVPVLVTCQCQ